MLICKDSTVKSFICKASCVFLFFFVLACSDKNVTKSLKLWYNAPASVWEEALPLGNGRIGAMVFGDPLNERYQLNEETLWSGFPKDGTNPKAKDALPLIRSLIDNGDYVEAAGIWQKNAQGPYSARYLPLANMHIRMQQTGDVKNMYRDLNISDAVATVKFEMDGVNYSRKTFISYPDQVMIVRIEADKKNAVSFELSLNSELRYEIKPAIDNCLILKGKAPSFVAHRAEFPDQIVYDENGEGMNFEIQVKVIIEGEGCLHEAKDSLLAIRNAHSATIILSAATSFNGIDKSPAFEGKSPALQAAKYLNQASDKPYKQLLKAHLQDYKSLFDKVCLTLGDDRMSGEAIPTDQRLRNFVVDDSETGLVELYYQYGRYLAIASSRPGGKASNLQGIWNQHVQPPWGSNYTTNINTEMNYWLTETANLPECHQPLFDLISLLSESGRKTAQINYGIQNGWVAHHNTDLWAQTAPTGGYDIDPKGVARWSCWPMAGVWLCQHLWEHYAFGGDRAFLETKAYPLMKGSALFMLEWLQEDKETGFLVTNPSSSPENQFYYTDKNGKQRYGQIAKATTMDMALIWDLFSNCIQASEILNVDDDFRNRLVGSREKLYSPHIGSQGQLQEWHKDFTDVDPKHRHASHLFWLHPGKQVLPRINPDLAAACIKTLEMRGDGGTGWAMAWKINFWARLENGNDAYKMMKNGLKFVDATEVSVRGGGTYANLFDACPPFQIDGNFGATAGITEMLVQSHGGEIFLLPALPDIWPEGKIKGIRARGGFVVDMEWKNGCINKVKIRSTIGGNCRIRTHIPLKSENAELFEAEGRNPNQFFFVHKAPKVVTRPEISVKPLLLKNTFVIDFETVKGSEYELSAKL